MELIDLERELNILTTDTHPESIDTASMIRADKDPEAWESEKLCKLIYDTIVIEYMSNNYTMGKAEHAAGCHERYRQQLEKTKLLKKEALKATAVHVNKLNRYKALIALISSYQSKMKLR